MSPRTAAITAFVLAIPMLVVLPSILLGLTPVEVFLKSIFTSDGVELTLLGKIFVNGGVIALPVAFLVNLLPFLKKPAEGVKRKYMLNVIVGLIIAALFLPIAYELWKDFYRCDILKIPYCD